MRSLNFRSVVKERGLSNPPEPVVFLKTTSSYLLEGQPIQVIIDCNDTGEIIRTLSKLMFNVNFIPQSCGPPSEQLQPATSRGHYSILATVVQIPVGFEVHHEIELGVIIRQNCKNIMPNEANNYIGGYCLALDLTAKNLMDTSRSKGLPWTIGKGFDTACPISSAISSDCLSNPGDLRLWLSVNDVIKQDCRTSDMIFSISDLLSFISKYMTLEPYDLILTGSPAGTGPIKKGDIIQGGLEDILYIKFNVN